MNILLISLNAKYVHLAPAPYALAAGISAFSHGDHRVRILDLTVNEPTEAILAAVRQEHAALIGLCCYIWNISLIRRLLPALRAAHPNARILLGGPEVSYRAAEMLSSCPEVDFILSGEGEQPIARLVDALADGTPLSAVEGLSFRAETGMRIGQPYVGLGTPPSPLSAGYAEAAAGKIAYLETSRGCPFHCTFCLSGRVGGVRFFDLEVAKADILRLAASHPRTVKFVDRTFNADRARARELLSFLIEHSGKEIPAELGFHFEMAGELLDEETVALLATAPRGLFRLELGLQSLSPDTLTAIGRRADTTRLCENIRRLTALGNVTVHIDLIAGLPREGYASFRRGFDLAYRLGAHMLQLGFLKLLYGAPLREAAEGGCLYRAEPPYEVVSTSAITAEELDRVRLAEIGCDRLYNSGRYHRILSRVLEDEKNSPYDLMEEAGRRLSRLPMGAPYKEEVACLYGLFSAYLDAEEVRDRMLLDYISTNSSRDIPPVLRRADPAYSAVKQDVARRLAIPKGERFSVAILYARGEIAVARYTSRDPVTGEYPLVLLRAEEAAAP